MKKIVLALLLVCTLCACSEPAQNSPSATPQLTSAQASPSPAVTPEATPSPTPEPDVYADIAAASSVGDTMAAKILKDPVRLNIGDNPQVKRYFALSGSAHGLSVMHPGYYAFAGTDEQGVEGLYGGSLTSKEGPHEPVYRVNAEYPHIGGVTGSKHCAYFVEYNDAAWRLMLINLPGSPNEADAPMLIDHGEGLPPALISSDGDMAYAVETAQGYEIRVWQRKWDTEILTEQLGVMTLPQNTLEPDRAFRLNSMGVTHVERSQGKYLAIAENLEGVVTAIASDKPLKYAQIGANAMAWIDENAAFCVYDPESGKTFRHGAQIAWYTPLDVFGEGVGYLYGGPQGLYAMAWDLDSNPLEMATYVIDEGNGWNYTACAVNLGDTTDAYALREQDGAWEMVRVRLAEAFG